LLFKKKYILAQYLTRFHKSLKDDISKDINDSAMNNEINEYLQEVPCHQENN